MTIRLRSIIIPPSRDVPLPEHLTRRVRIEALQKVIRRNTDTPLGTARVDNTSLPRATIGIGPTILDARAVLVHDAGRLAVREGQAYAVPSTVAGGVVVLRRGRDRVAAVAEGRGRSGHRDRCGLGRRVRGAVLGDSGAGAGAEEAVRRVVGAHVLAGAGRFCIRRDVVWDGAGVDGAGVVCHGAGRVGAAGGDVDCSVWGVSICT